MCDGGCSCSPAGELNIDEVVLTILINMEMNATEENKKLVEEAFLPALATVSAKRVEEIQKKVMGALLSENRVSSFSDVMRYTEYFKG